MSACVHQPILVASCRGPACDVDEPHRPTAAWADPTTPIATVVLCFVLSVLRWIVPCQVLDRQVDGIRDSRSGSQSYPVRLRTTVICLVDANSSSPFGQSHCFAGGDGAFSSACVVDCSFTPVFCCDLFCCDLTRGELPALGRVVAWKHRI